MKIYTAQIITENKTMSFTKQERREIKKKTEGRFYFSCIFDRLLHHGVDTDEPENMTISP